MFLTMNKFKLFKIKGWLLYLIEEGIRMAEKRG